MMVFQIPTYSHFSPFLGKQYTMGVYNENFAFASFRIQSDDFLNVDSWITQMPMSLQAMRDTVWNCAISRCARCAVRFFSPHPLGHLLGVYTTGTLIFPGGHEIPALNFRL